MAHRFGTLPYLCTSLSQLGCICICGLIDLHTCDYGKGLNINFMENTIDEMAVATE